MYGALGEGILLTYDKYDEECYGNSKWERDIHNDLKKGIDLMFDFKEELHELHPAAVELIAKILKV